MSKHTPGPWEADGTEVIGQIEWTYEIATAWSNAEISVDDAEANARLIAAAPDLLEVVERFATFEWLGESEMNDLVKKCRAIMARIKENG